MTILMWVGIIVGALVVLLVVVPILWLRIAGTEPEGVAVEITAPSSVKMGETLAFNVTVSNLLDRPRVLHSIDLDNALAKGLGVERVEPEPVDRSSMLGTTAYHFNRLPIPPKGSITLTVHGRAAATGTHSGTVMAYVDSKHAKSEDRFMQVEVRDKV